MTSNPKERSVAPRGGPMSRRSVLLLAGVTLLAPALALAQPKPPAKMPRVAVIFVTSPPSEFQLPDPLNPAMRAFVHGMREAGYVHGRNVILDLRSLESRWQRLDDMVADLARLKTDVLHIPATPLLMRVRKLNTTIPIVWAGSSDLAGTGLVQSLSRPGGNITGMTTDVGTDVEGKRLELLLGVLPKPGRVAYLGAGEWQGSAGDGVRSIAERLGLSVFHAGATTSDYSAAMEQMRREKVNAFFVEPSATSYGFRRVIGEFAVKSGIPSSCPWSELAEQGCLMSYGVNVQEVYRRLTTHYVDRILKGAKAGDLPIERPTKFDLVVNLRTAKAIGLSIPQSFLVRADRVIE
ncbi:MAG: ABC transporter substrate-binding protein [Betaproteobacteria bacterium]